MFVSLLALSVAVALIGSLLTGEPDSCDSPRDGSLPHKDCIRLLRIQYGIHDESISYTSERFHIESAPPYRALSWTWGYTGEVNETAELWRKDGNLTLPTNLHNAIKYLYGIPSQNWYWIDYFSINQSDMVEKGHQVASMGRIYRRAERVDVWLGQVADQDFQRMSSILNYVSELSEWHEAHPDIKRTSDYDSDAWAPPIPEEDWQHLRHLFSRRWFHRLWALQEFVLARQIDMYMGYHQIDVAKLERAASFLFSQKRPMHLDYGTNGTAGRSIQQQIDLRESINNVSSLEKMLSRLGHEKEKQYIADYESVLALLFWRSSATYASDPRDYVYGILGIADIVMDQFRDYYRTIGVKLPFYEPFPADYSLETPEVFRRFTIRLLKSRIGIRALTLIANRVDEFEVQPDFELQIRSMATWKDPDHRLPSWVPNLANRDNFPLSSDDGLDPHEVLTPVNVHGSPDKTHKPKFKISENQLLLYGRRIGVSRGSMTHYSLPIMAERGPCTMFGLTAAALANSYSWISSQVCDAASIGPKLRPLELILSNLSLGHWKQSTNASMPAGNSNGTARTTSIQFEKFLEYSIASFICGQMEQHPAHDNTVDKLFRNLHLYDGYLGISGTSDAFFQKAIQVLRKPERAFDWPHLHRCMESISRDGLDKTQCPVFVREFHQAQGRVLFFASLDEEYEYPFCKCDSRTGDEPFDSFLDNESDGESEYDFGSKWRPLIGLGPRDADVGDEIWAVQGSAWPLVLRAAEVAQQVAATAGEDDAKRLYFLVGEAYIHGIMNGELFNETQIFEEVTII